MDWDGSCVTIVEKGERGDLILVESHDQGRQLQLPAFTGESDKNVERQHWCPLTLLP